MHATRLYVILGLFIATGVVLELFAFVRAPLGYQDEDGFHSGVQKKINETATRDLNLG